MMMMMVVDHLIYVSSLVCIVFLYMLVVNKVLSLRAQRSAHISSANLNVDDDDD